METINNMYVNNYMPSMETMQYQDMNNLGYIEDQTREEMLKEIMCYKFAITDIALYLDTHPEDQKALCLHREYCNKYRNLSDQYQKVYGPLTIQFPCNKWRWLEEPWPWEGGEC